MTDARAGDRLRREIDPDTHAWLERSQQVARSAADFEHAGAGRHLPPEYRREPAMIVRAPSSAVAAAPDVIPMRLAIARIAIERRRLVVRCRNHGKIVGMIAGARAPRARRRI